jgi:hypothetical protein
VENKFNITSEVGRGQNKGRTEENLFSFMKLSVRLEFTSIFKVQSQLGDFFGTRVETQHIHGDNEGTKFIQKPRKDLSQIVTYIFINPEAPNSTLNEYLTLYHPFIRHKYPPPIAHKRYYNGGVKHFGYPASDVFLRFVLRIWFWGGRGVALNSGTPHTCDTRVLMVTHFHPLQPVSHPST